MTNFRTGNRARATSKALTKEPDLFVLVIEDQRSLSNLLKSLLSKRLNAEIHVAATYQEARELLKKSRTKYLVAICDIQLPDAPKGEIIDLVHRADLPIIGLSGKFTDDFFESMLNKGIIDYVHKDSLNAYSYVVDVVSNLYRNQKISVLVVDDSPSARALIVHMLELQNFQVIQASDGEEALNIINNNPKIKLLITDYQMPKLDGFQLTLKVREFVDKQQLSIIGLSAKGGHELGPLFLKNGANDFLSKPFSYEELLCRINHNIELLEHIEHIEKLANSDFLTKLSNRRFFFTECQKKLSNATKLQLGMAMVDIDFFKKINDSYGHDCGDEVLIQFSNLLMKHFPTELVARLGGEEFAIFFEDSTQKEIKKSVENFRTALEALCPIWEDEKLIVTASIGLTYQYQASADAMLKIADENLYKAKNSGRNRVVD